MKAGEIIDVTLRSMRVADVKPMSSTLVGTLPNGEPYEVVVPFDADVRTAPVERNGEVCAVTAPREPYAARHRAVEVADLDPTCPVHLPGDTTRMHQADNCPGRSL